MKRGLSCCCFLFFVYTPVILQSYWVIEFYHRSVSHREWQGSDVLGTAAVVLVTAAVVLGMVAVVLVLVAVV